MGGCSVKARSPGRMSLVDAGQRRDANERFRARPPGMPGTVKAKCVNPWGLGRAVVRQFPSVLRHQRQPRRTGSLLHHLTGRGRLIKRGVQLCDLPALAPLSLHTSDNESAVKMTYSDQARIWRTHRSLEGPRPRMDPVPITRGGAGRRFRSWSSPTMSARISFKPQPNCPRKSS